MVTIPLLLFATFFQGAHASSFYERPFPDTVREASSIVRGKVGKSEVQWVTLSDGGKRLFTFYDVEVSEGFKGKPKGGVIRMRELGGEKDGVGLQISGAAQFSPGEDVVVMLGDSTDSGDTYPLAGMMMGKYTLEKNADGKEVLRGSGLGSSVHPAFRKEGDPAMKDKEVTLEGLREIVRKQASEPAPTPSPSTAANPSGDQLLSSKATVGKAPLEEKLESEPKPVKKTGLPIRPVFLLLGLAGGIYWFLKTKKNRR